MSYFDHLDSSENKLRIKIIDKILCIVVMSPHGNIERRKDLNQHTVSESIFMRLSNDLIHINTNLISINKLTLVEHSL